MQVQHTCHAIKSETIKLVLIHPESQVAEQESHDFMMAVVEEPAVPLIMASPTTCMEILMVRPIKLIQSIEDILGSMTVDDIQQDDKTQAVGGVDKLLQILRRAIAAAGGEEIVDLVAKTGVVCMLHNSHELDDIVAKILDAWEHVLGELLVGCYSELGRRDTDMCLIYTNALWLLRPLVFKDVFIFGRRVPESCIVGG